MLFLATPASAQAIWRVTNADLGVTERPLTDEDLDFSDDAGPVLMVQQHGEGFGRAAGWLRLFLANGDAVRGELVGLTDETIAMQTLDFGRVEIPLDQAVALASSEMTREPAWWADRPLVDAVELENGDRVTGFIAGLEGEELIVEDEGGNDVRLPAKAVRVLRFADTGLAPAEAELEPVARVLLTDWSEISVYAIERGEDGRFGLDWQGQRKWLPPEHFWAIEPIASPVRWLAELAPDEQVQQPYLSATFPTQANVGLSSFIRGDAGRSLIVHSRSRITYTLPAGGWTHFRAEVGIDHAAGTPTYADVDVRVLLDGDVAFEHSGLTTADGLVPIDVPLAEAAELTLEVDYGRNLDVQDRVLWCRPVLSR